MAQDLESSPVRETPHRKDPRPEPFQHCVILSSVDIGGPFGPPPLCLVDFRDTLPSSLFEVLRSAGVLVWATCGNTHRQEKIQEWRALAKRPYRGEDHD